MFENRLPLTEFYITDVIDNHGNNQPVKLTIKIQSRCAKISDNPDNDPTKANAWRYIIVGDTYKLGIATSEDNNYLLKTNIGPIINVKRSVPLEIIWVSELLNDTMVSMMPAVGFTDPLLEMPPINPLPMAYADAEMLTMNPSVGVVTHLHGGRVPDHSDGWPLEPISYPGNPFYTETATGNIPFATQKTVTYPNDQRAAMLWFHDHGMDNTAPQVHAGLAGLYFIRDESDDQLATKINAYNTLQNNYVANEELLEIPLVIQDRVVDCDFCCVDYWAGIPTQYDNSDPQNPVLNKLRPEFLGDTIFVNGRPWPHHKVTQKVYRLRLLNGSNARTYALALINPSPWTTTENIDKPTKIWYSDCLTVIGNEAGLYAASQTLGEQDYLLIAPGERLDVLLDLTRICPHETPKLRLVNLAVQSVFNNEWPEAIFQSEALSIFSLPTTPAPTLPSGLINQNYIWLNSLLAIKQANIMQFCIEHIDSNNCVCNVDDKRLAANQAEFKIALDALLLTYDTKDTAKNPEFVYSDGKLQLPNGKVVDKNRLVVLMNNTGTGLANEFTEKPDWTDAAGKHPDWHDTQMWEMAEPLADPVYKPFKLPFTIDLRTVGNPAAVILGGYQPYNVARSTFLEADATPIAKNSQRKYADLRPATIKPTSGTYERWYVANIGNWQPGINGVAGVPDMHPFHIHLVNFVVLRRFSFRPVDQSNPVDYHFVDVTPEKADFYDKNIRHDTVRINSNEMVELLVYFPEGYHGKYPYHCHLVEHEDMGMMLHFEVSPA